jgi:toxin ParE1/3/4
VAVLIQDAASLRLDEIYRYTKDKWGDDQAEKYITGVFEAFERIETFGVLSRPVPAEFGVDGYFFRYHSHFVYWRRLLSDDIGIVTILHQRMHQIARLKDEFGNWRVVNRQRGVSKEGSSPNMTSRFYAMLPVPFGFAPIPDMGLSSDSP